MKGVVASTLLTILFLQCSQHVQEKPVPDVIAETSLKEAMNEWPEVPQQITFIGLQNCLTKFQVYWNGALSCFVGRDCFGNIFPPQQEITRQF